LSSAARAFEQQPATRPLPIDGPIIWIGHAIAGLDEEELQRGALTHSAEEYEQRQRLRDAKDYLIRAQALVRQYNAKGPTA
jgi:hypothetical protein